MEVRGKTEGWVLLMYAILNLKKVVVMSPKLPRITAFDLLRALRRDGWLPIRQSGSHVTLNHALKKGRITVPNHSGTILKLKTLETILKQAELTTDELQELL